MSVASHPSGPLLDEIHDLVLDAVCVVDREGRFVYVRRR